MNLFRSASLALALSLAMTSVHAATDSFATETEALLTKSRDNKTGLVFHVDGATIGAYVVEIKADVIVAASREHRQIMIRRSSIDAVSAP